MILQGETPVQSVPMPWFFQTIKNRIKVFLILLFPGSVILNSQIIARQFLALSVQSLMEWNKIHFSISAHNFIFLSSFFLSLNDCDSHLTSSHIKCEWPNDCDFLWTWTQKQFWRCSTDFHSPFSHIATVDLFLTGKGVLKNVELQLILWNETSVLTAFYSWFCVVRSFFHSARRSGGVSSWWS